MTGIGEKFSANPVTGTGSMSVPIAVSSGRSGFGPQLKVRVARRSALWLMTGLARM
jgi:Salmonella virulence plasmid 65kDa B protein